KIETHTFQNDSIGPIKLTISIGVAVGDANYSTQQKDWLAVADKCLYYAKDNGRNQTAIEVVDIATKR
ncbi:MAG: GGDEF domain-containing protein, partial [Colwellia sp.]